jgi:hypothetical protein
VLPSIKAAATLTVALFATAHLALALSSDEKAYSPKSGDETEILSLVLNSEVQTNHWTKKDLVCFSVDGKNPSRELVKALRKQKLNICSSAEWPRKSNCGFEVQLQFLSFDASQSAKLHVVVADFRDINNGDAHVAVRLKDGEYKVRKINGEWSISEYAPSK